MDEAQTPATSSVTETTTKPVSEPGTLLGIFVNPRGTFASMAPKPRFLLATILIVVVQVILGVLVFQSGAVKADAIAKMEAKGDPQERIDAVQTWFDSPAAPIVGAVSGAVVIVFILLLNAGILFFMANLMLGAQLTFRHYFSVSAYSVVVGILDQCVRTALAWSKGTMDIRLGLGNFLGEDLGHIGHMLDTLTDPLVLWSVLVSAVGVSTYARKKLSFGILAVIPGFLINVLLSGMR